MSAVLLPTVLALVTTAAAVLAYIAWTTAAIDQRALERQTDMIAQEIDRSLKSMPHDLESVAIWDDSVIRTRDFDYGWVHSNMGVWLHEFFGHDLSSVVDSNNIAIYAMRDGAADHAVIGMPIDNAIAALVARVRAQSDVTTGIVEDADFMLLDGRPAVVAAMAIVPETRAVWQAIGNQHILVAARYLDGAFADRLSRDYLADGGRFTLFHLSDPHRAVYPVLNRSGRLVAFFEWQRDQPGLLMLKQTGPALLAAFVVAGILVFFLLRQLRRSASALERGRRHAEYQAAHDGLTGLPNRSSFDAHLAQKLAEAPREGSQVTLLMLDLDRFKHVNDTLGHQAGDTLIRAVSRRLSELATPETLIARLGGDEFALVTVTRPEKNDVSTLSQRIIQAIAVPFEIGPFKAHVGVSIGIVHSTTVSDPLDLVRKADIALYEAKAGGRNRAVVFEERMSELLQLQHTIEGELREALQRDDQLSVVFQPLVDEKSRRVIGAEALARWYHPKYGQISPARFIPVAENTGLVEALGAFVLRRACEMGAGWPGRTVAVNISPTQLRNPQFANQVFDALHGSGMRAMDLELEITEAILLDDEHASSQNLRMLRAAGIHIALDDFGTGYSSLSYLKRYPVDRIKIDRSFVNQLAQGHVSVAITRAIVTLAHAMDIKVTAEGVETDQQAAILGELGCNTLQGFLFSGGVSPEEITAVFADPLNAPARRNTHSGAAAA
jgi:diguanylate cyclase (GGDEF)-like protein